MYICKYCKKEYDTEEKMAKCEEYGRIGEAIDKASSKGMLYIKHLQAMFHVRITKTHMSLSCVQGRFCVETFEGISFNATKIIALAQRAKYPVEDIAEDIVPLSYEEAWNLGYRPRLKDMKYDRVLKTFVYNKLRKCSIDEAYEYLKNRVDTTNKSINDMITLID